MARSIWKFPLRVADFVEFAMPKNAKVLTVQVQLGDPCVWAEVDVGAETEIRRFRTFGTGHPLDSGLLYIGTYQMRDGALVFHLYEDVS